MYIIQLAYEERFEMYFHFSMAAMDGINSDIRLVEVILLDGIVDWAIENTFSIYERNINSYISIQHPTY